VNNNNNNDDPAVARLLLEAAYLVNAERRQVPTADVINALMAQVDAAWQSAIADVPTEEEIDALMADIAVAEAAYLAEIEAIDNEYGINEEDTPAR
jgi:hypothetical protein